jgi:branched-chain amino acid transport system permease protein
MTEFILQLLANGVSTGVGYAFVALGLTLVFGVLHVINFAHGEVFMVGALAALLGTRAGLPYLATLPLALLAGIVVGAVLDWVCVRPLLARSHDKSEVLLATFAASIIVFEAVFVLFGAQAENVPGIAGVWTLGGVAVPQQRVFVLCAGVVVFVGLELLLKRTAFGVQMRAVAQSTFAARLVGIRVSRVNSLTFLLASAIAGLGGALLAPVILYSPQIGHAVIIKAFVVVVMGGLGSVRGAVLFGVLLGVVEALAGAFMSEGFAAAAIYALMLVTLLWRPHGLLGRPA